MVSNRNLFLLKVVETLYTLGNLNIMKKALCFIHCVLIMRARWFFILFQ